jgi:transposase, IS30 family
MPTPPLDPRVVRRVLDLLAQGRRCSEVPALVGVSIASVYRIQARVGGVFRPPDSTYCDRYLDRDERYELARLLEAGHSQRQIAALLGRDPSTVSRELRRNRCPRTGRYVPERADRLAWQRQRRPKQSRLATRPRLRERVQQMLDERYSPEQVAGRLRIEHPENQEMWVSHETIYQSVYVYPRGELTRELKAHLRTRRTQRRRRGRVERPGPIPDPVSIHERPEEVAGRKVPGHHEGDLIKGSVASNSAIGTIVERHSGYLTLVDLPDGLPLAKYSRSSPLVFSLLPRW